VFGGVVREGVAVPRPTGNNAPVAGDWPLVGRDDELALLRSLRESGSRQGAVVIGPPGVGKSRLVQEAAAEAEAAGMLTVRVAGTTGAARLPFAPLLPPPETHPEGAGRGDLLHRLHAGLVERCGGDRFLLLIDDAHLLDDDSAALAHQLAATASAFVLATVRAGEQPPKRVVGLWEGGLAEPIALAGLPEDVVADLLAHVLGGPVEEASAVRLAGHSQGNVLFLRELVLGALASGALRLDDGVHHLVGPLTPSDRLVELLEARFISLDERERRALEVLAVGEPLGAAELEPVACSGIVERLEALGLVTRRPVGRRLELRLGHPLYGDVLRTRLPPLRLRSLQRGLADALEATGPKRREDTLRLATWRLDGGGAVNPGLMLEGARVARSQWALRLAERLARAALDAGAGFEAGLLLGQLYAFHGRAEEAETVLSGMVPTAADDEQRALLAASRMYNLAAWGPLDEALEVADEADRSIGHPEARDEVAASRALVLDLAGRTREAVEIVVPLLDRAEGRALASAGFSGSVALGVVGRLEEAITAAERGVDAYRRLAGRGLGIDAFMCTSMRMTALGFAGRLEEATTWGAAEYEAAVAAGSMGARAFVSMHLARVYLTRGWAQSAGRHAQEAVALYRPGGFLTLLYSAAIPLAQASALLGRVEDARAILGELDDLGLGPDRLYGTEFLQARAWTDIAAGDLASGVDHLEAAVVHARTRGDAVPESAALHDLVRLGRADTVAGRLQELAKVIEGQLVRARAAHAAAVAEGNGRGLEEASATFEALGADLLAAEAAVQAAEARRANGQSEEAERAERRAVTLASRCQQAMTPPLRPISGHRAGHP
jgi:tetratricopeptide (TPR) repeat protein